MNRRSVGHALAAAVLACAAAFAIADGDGEPGAESLRGSVCTPGGRPLSWVLVKCVDSGGRWHRSYVGQDGGFAFSGLPKGRVVLKADMYGWPRKKTITKRAMAGDQDVRIVIDPHPELIIRVEGKSFEYGLLMPRKARLYAKTDDGVQGWFATVEKGALRFRRIQPGGEWTLWIPWGEDVGGTALLSGTELAPGEQLVQLEPGKRIRGTVSPISPFLGRFESGVAFRRGHVTVNSGLVEGEFVSPPLPVGTWEVVAYDSHRELGYRMATTVADVGEAGAVVDLELAPVSREEWLRRPR